MSDCVNEMDKEAIERVEKNISNLDEAFEKIDEEIDKAMIITQADLREEFTKEVERDE